MAVPLAGASDVVTAWRPLSSIEQERAEYWIERASRRVRRRWRDVDERIASAEDDPRHLERDDVVEVIVCLVVDVLGGPEVPHARAMSVGSGTESRSVQLDRTGAMGLPPFAGWMVEIFEGTATAPGPVYFMPRPMDLDRVFVTKEGPR